jgi:RHS repeat-associated protein
VGKTVTGGTNSVSTYVYDATGQLAAEYATGVAQDSGTTYLTADHLGSTRLVTDGGGNPVHRFDYMPFGEDLSGFGNRNLIASYNMSAVPTEKFTGKERDAETGLDYFGARYFSSAQGRWTSPDKPFADQHIEDPQSWNLYAYVRNNPLRLVDDTGEGAKEKLEGAWQGAQNFVNHTMVGFLSTVLEPDVAVSNAWNGVKGIAQTAFTSMGRQAFADQWNSMSEQQKAALVTEAGLTVLGAVLSKGESGEGGLAASVGESFGFKSFGTAGSVIGGELEGGGSALIGVSRSGEQLGVNISMVSGPAGTVAKLEQGAINAAKAQGASTLELKASMVKDSMGRLLRKNGFTQEIKDGKATGNWIKTIKINDNQ